MLKVIRVRIAGIDIGSDKVFVSISGQKVMIFETYTDSFKALVVYLQSHSIESRANL